MAKTLWTAESLQQALGLSGLPPIHGGITGISIDSRTVQPGDLFIPLKGPNFDGNEYVAEALTKGAGAALTDRTINGAITVEDTFEALQGLATFKRQQTAAKIIAITGSSGKTSVTRALAHALTSQGTTHSSYKSFNNKIGLPVIMASLPDDAAYYVQELGMSEAGEISNMVKLLRPHMSIITMVGPAHLEYFNSVDDIARAKAEVMKTLPADGLAALPKSSPYFDILKDAAGAHSVAEFTAFINPPANLPGPHWAENVGAILAITNHLDLPQDDILKALKTFNLPAGRGERSVCQIKDTPFTMIDESYNANPASIVASLHVLSTVPGRKIAILGDMLELGKNSPALHADLADAVTETAPDLIITHGPMMQHLHQAIPSNINKIHCESLDDIQEKLASSLQPHDTVMIKGSNGTKLHTLVDRFKQLHAA